MTTSYLRLPFLVKLYQLEWITYLGVQHLKKVMQWLVEMIRIANYCAILKLNKKRKSYQKMFPKRMEQLKHRWRDLRYWWTNWVIRVLLEELQYNWRDFHDVFVLLFAIVQLVQENMKQRVFDPPNNSSNNIQLRLQRNTKNAIIYLVSV